MNKLNELTIKEAGRGLENGKFSVTELVTACLEKIKSTNNELNSFITVCEKESLAKAKEFDQTLSNQPSAISHQPLFGIPIAVKDNFCTKDIRTTAASKVLDNFIPPYDAEVVARLKKAGAIIIGKTNMDAWAHGSSTETSAYGTVKNPHNTKHSPGGSSGGSAAAVAADQVIAAVGSETAGSIRQPASWCGVVGFKPTYGRVSRWGLIAMASSTDSPGPITKTVEDAAIMIKVLAGKDNKDATSSDEKADDYLDLKTDPQKITIGVPKEYFLTNMDSGVKKIIKDRLAQLENSGFRIKEISLLDPKYSIAVYTIVQRAEVSSNLARFDGIRYGSKRTNFGPEPKRRIMLGAHVLSSGYYDQYYTKAQKVRTLIKKDLDKAFESVDIIAAPTSPTTALKIGESEKSPMFGEMQDVLVEASSLAGLPGISINAGYTDGLPVGIQFFGPQFKEKLILQIGQFFEKNV